MSFTETLRLFFIRFFFRTEISVKFSPTPLTALYDWDEKCEWRKQRWSGVIGTNDVTTIVGPNITCLCLNIIDCETKSRLVLMFVQIYFLNFTYLNKAISKLINSILTKSIWKANMTCVAIVVLTSGVATERNERIYR